MNEIKILKRISAALLNSLTSGVTPRLGIEHIAVGRKREIETLLGDLENISYGGSVFRFIVGRYGSGKSFLLQILKTYAVERGYIVADADLSPERKLIGGNQSGLATYRELLRSMSNKVRPDGGALTALLDKWLDGIQVKLIAEGTPENEIPMMMERRILLDISAAENLVHGFDFSKVLQAYWRGFNTGDDELKNSAMKWLRGEYAAKTDAVNELGVRAIITDDNWFDYIKLLSAFVSILGYKGLIILLDEGVNLYKISNTISRNNNYEKLLNMFNEAMQGKVQSLGAYMCGTPQFVEDMRRGLFSYEALRTRLSGSRFMKDGMKDMQGPLIYLEKLTHEELYVLLQRVMHLHSVHYGYDPRVTDAELVGFMQIVANRLGADELLTPREVLRDFTSILNYIHQNPEQSFASMLGEDILRKITVKSAETDDGADDEAVEIII
ncbi:MAG: ATP-binding protein [Defluviitaleaceae bacterium]|nr:ATP-binding protein [Defluviitaleaceae bacterium]MCL2835238.1 ATP-binding protein [Defluviitaleaceae bacterium]